MTATPPDVPIKPARRSLLERVSVVWIIPVAALVIALGVAWQSYTDRGPLLEIEFENASGVIAGQTELRYRDVAVGLVEDVAFTASLDQVLVSVRVNKDVAAFIDEGSQFYVVRPEISARGVTGLETVLSGVYIQGVWDTEATGFRQRHEGAPDEPLLTGDQRGLKISLRSTAEAGLTERAPIIFQGIEVGRIGKAEISRDGSTVQADAVIFAPHDRLISTATRFWDASGFSFKIGPGGASIDFSSLAALVSGGITFQTVVSGGDPVRDGQEFVLYPDEGAARASVFAAEEGDALDLTAIFDENVSGLSVDAPVDLGGVRVGRVTALNGIVDPLRFGDNRVRLAATLTVQPGRIGLDGTPTADEALDFLAERVEAGMRARLATASILTGGLKVELIVLEDPDSAPARLDMSNKPNPLMPTTESDIADVSASAEGVFERINSLPIEELLQSAINLMDNISRVAGSPDLRELPTDLRGTVDEVRGAVSEVRSVLGSDSVQALPDRIASVADQIEALVTQLNEQNAAGRVLAAVDAAKAAADNVSGATSGLPELIASLDAVARKAEGLPLEELTTEITDLAEQARLLVSADATQTLPAAISATLAEIDTLLSDAREKGMTDSIVAALNSARDAAAQVSTSFEGVPALIDRLNAVAAKAETVPLDQLSQDLSALMQSADRVLDTDGARQLPEDLGNALNELQAVLTELREGGVVNNVNATFSSAREAADALRDVAGDLPAVLAQARNVLAQAANTIKSYDGDRGVGRDVSIALREVQRAAESVSSLARALQRAPNSLLFGR